MPRHIFALRVELLDVTPTVWRRLLVPGAYTLDRLHRVLQYAFGWRDCHLHSFDIESVAYGVPDPDDELQLLDEMEHRVDAVLGKASRFRYTYDFGDWWEHDLTVEDVTVADPDQRYPICLDGANPGPPEGVGGPSGYAEYRAALADRRHPEHERMLEWSGGSQLVDQFDAGRVTTLLRRLT